MSLLSWTRRGGFVKGGTVLERAVGLGGGGRLRGRELQTTIRVRIYSIVAWILRNKLQNEVKHKTKKVLRIPCIVGV